MSTEEEKGLLEVANEDNGLNIAQGVLPRRKQSRILRASLAANVVLLLICALLVCRAFLLPKCSSNQRSGQDTENNVVDSYSPANPIIEYHYKPMIFNDTRFVGRPGVVWEESMQNLLSGTLIRISNDELKLHGAPSIPLKDGGYAAGLGVGHNLHCVQFLFREISYPNLDPSNEEFDVLQSHADHCLDFLRQDVMCHLDYTLYSLYWGDQEPPLLLHRYPQRQKCVNWEKVHEWMLDRVANSDMLIHSKRR
ncbi:hypothetical protein F5Y10DRAFT_291010 [Nemania abortiva]|nr:hypothetical protein F5Y10DRAFT_291010 [Nemania abortiva]